jgi:hypothetical protein
MRLWSRTSASTNDTVTKAPKITRAHAPTDMATST